MKKVRAILLTILIAIIPKPACSQSENKSLENQVVLYYKNRNEPEKIKAAQFLFANMKYHYTNTHQEIDRYHQALASINKSYSYPACKGLFSELYETISLDESNIQKQYDADILTKDYIIENIDKAYSAWKQGLWAQHITFNDFCEYLLPYRVGNEKTEPWREKLSGTYLPKITWIQNQDDKRNSAFWAAGYLNDQIKNKGFHVESVPHLFGTDFPVSVLENIRMGECQDYAELTAYIMRACGIPVAIDFTPQWPFRSSGHYWNTLLDNTGKNIPFMGGESNPGYPCKAGYAMAKVYRQTFAFQPNSLFACNETVKENVPEILNSPFIKDVSNEYFMGVDIPLMAKEIKLRHKNFIYLAVFNNQNWVPITFAPTKDKDTIMFRGMGRDIVYLPVTWGAVGAIDAYYPILVTSDGKIDILKPDTNKKQTITLSRKFPIFGGVLSYSKRVVNGYFEGSNSKDFADAEICARIIRNPQMKYDSVEVTSKQAYRYWRYISPKSGHCNIAEIMLKSKGKECIPADYFCDGNIGKGYKVTDAFDHNELTFYQSNVSSNAWIAVDLGQPIVLDKIVYLPRNDDNNVVPGHSYQLEYYENGQRITTTPQQATGYTVSFHNIPCHALYILHDLTKGREERIFTYNNNKIKWY